MEAIDRFLSISSGDGSGSGSGDGYGYGSGSGSGYGYGYGSGSGSGYGYGSGSGSGYGYGYGYGYGDGDGYGYGSGSGSGDGSGSGVKSFNSNLVYSIDSVQTIITHVHGNHAIGFILGSDLTLKPCYVAKNGNYFAHGETLKQAVKDAQNKHNQNLSKEERIELFWKQFNNVDKFPAKDFFEWHTILTGSCDMGKREFCKSRNIDIDSDSFTVPEFIELTKFAYGSNVIKLLTNSPHPYK